ncbi:unnamed protein product [Caenorhabditis auriculariae]|uniref:Uncharacterized protein n=1 Tax=Caenorhabditis auriculariae TaxID=2777116 RepID=A0A8S1GN91_9PELO|nr:unnamed protein product [Caenorhabditis auriculariae]
MLADANCYQGASIVYGILLRIEIAYFDDPVGVTAATCIGAVVWRPWGGASVHSFRMSSFLHAVLLALFCSLIIIEAMPRVPLEKKAMRNSLVRFGKRGEPLSSDDVFLGESFGPADPYEYVPEHYGRNGVYGLY